MSHRKKQRKWRTVIVLGGLFSCLWLLYVPWPTHSSDMHLEAEASSHFKKEVVNPHPADSLDFGFLSSQLSSNEIDVLLIPFAPSTRERLIVHESYALRGGYFNRYISNALGAERFFEFARATWPGRHLVTQLARTYNLGGSTVDQMYHLVKIYNEAAPRDRAGFEFSVAMAREIKSLLPGVPKADLSRLIAIAFPSIDWAELQIAYPSQLVSSNAFLARGEIWMHNAKARPAGP